ncbi:TonB-dependent receptor [Puniceicoccales bacterium CK1056]|uniref:TonB-dependent receptor n=1 Tax=Oceanipulchritudo coccoides TaxID=2706888 RepID=A0A6B2M1B4_9BACT|nr:TonB-dependent receptor [Oceanipulchritudo coccoides]NDV61914.1 TonB-dependent receptor [Oceanipulchritudo coccoides]
MRLSLFLACCVGISLHADDLIELNPFIVVAPNLLPLDGSLPGEQIRESKPLDLATILSEEMPSIALSRKSPLAGDIVLRGMTRDNILITVDNTKTFCACPNRMDPPAFHVSSQQIEAISVRAGPFSVRQGATTGGAVFVKTTPAPDSLSARAYGFVGSFGYRAAGITAGAPLQDGKAQLQAGLYTQYGDVFEDGDGIPFTRLPGTNYQNGRMTGQAFKVINLETKLSVNLSGGKVIAFNYALQDAQDVLYPGLKMDALTDTLNRGGISFKMPMESGIADSLSVSVAVSTVDHDMRDTFRKSALMNPAFAERGYMMRTESKTGYFGLMLEGRKELDAGVLSYGLDLMERQWDAANQIMMMENDMLPDVSGRSAGAWAVMERAVEAWKYELGARVDYTRSRAQDDISFVQALRGTSTNKTDDLLASAYVLTSYDLDQNRSLFLGLGHGERLPDPQERYLNLNRPTGKPDWVGNPDLKPVQNTEIQVGGRFQVNGFSTSVSVFHSWLGDYIYLGSIQTTNTKATTYENIDARLYGTSLDLSYQLADRWNFRSAIAWQEGVKSSSLPGSSNKNLAEVPPLKAVFSLTWKGESVAVRCSAQFQDDLSRIDTDLNEQPIDSSWVINLAAHWNLNSHITLSGGVDNLLDETYAVANSHLRDPFSSSVIVNEPGRFFFLRLSAEY